MKFSQVSSLDDIKTNSQTDSNAAKTMALDHLGVIAARIRTSVLKVQRDPPSKKGLRPLDDASFEILYFSSETHIVPSVDCWKRKFEVLEPFLGGP